MSAGGGGVNYPATRGRSRSFVFTSAVSFNNSPPRLGLTAINNKKKNLCFSGEGEAVGAGEEIPQPDGGEELPQILHRIERGEKASHALSHALTTHI